MKRCVADELVSRLVNAGVATAFIRLQTLSAETASYDGPTYGSKKRPHSRPGAESTQVRSPLDSF